MRERSLGRVAVVLSLVLHGLLAFVLSQVSTSGAGRKDRFQVLDTRVKMRAPELDIDVVLVDPPRPKALPTEAEPPKVSAAAPAPAQEAVHPSETPQPVATPLHASRAPAPEPGGGSGSAETTSFFQIGTHGKTIVYVIDRSTSMGLHGLLQTAKRELLASLEKLPADVRFQVILYNRSAELQPIGGTRGPVPATPENKRQIALALDAVQAEGGTEHLPALRRALALHPDVIFFLTDADDLSLDQVRIVTHLNRGQAAIHAIELNAAHRPDEQMPLPQLARNNRGVYRGLTAASGE